MRGAVALDFIGQLVRGFDEGEMRHSAAALDEAEAGEVQRRGDDDGRRRGTKNPGSKAFGDGTVYGRIGAECWVLGAKCGFFGAPST